jgi:predicted glycogen debranching enzyme
MDQNRDMQWGGVDIGFGTQVCGSLDEGATREWLVTDGLGGFAMGTVCGLRTRRYHGLLVVATDPPIGRQLALACLDPVLVLGDRQVRLGTHEWGSGAVDPAGHVHLESFEVRDGVPAWRYVVGEVALEVEVAMEHGRPSVGVVHRLLRAAGPVRVAVEPWCTWRDAHGERLAGPDPIVAADPGGFTFEDRYRVTGPGYRPGGTWYRDVRYRTEADRGLSDREDLWHAGAFTADLEVGGVLEVSAWAGSLGGSRPPASAVVEAARTRAAGVCRRAGATGRVDRMLALAADQHVVAGPTVVAGYPWFGDWSRDTMTSYDGLFLATGHAGEGRSLLEAAAASVSEGMLANTADIGGTRYNTVDATLWFVHALHRHVAVTGDLDLAAELAPVLGAILDAHVAGTRYGIRAEEDGLLTAGATGEALTWMDARVDGSPVTRRAGKPVEVNALWVNALAAMADLLGRTRGSPTKAQQLLERARASFAARFPLRGGEGGGLFDVVDGPAGDDPTLRPNQLLAVSLPFAPLRDAGIVEACSALLTPLGLRSLAPAEPGYRGQHRGPPAERDAAYHQGTVWPWMIGPYVEARLRLGLRVDRLLDGLVAHVGEWGVGSVSETADGDPPHGATGCPFQAWSVAELVRVRKLLGDGPGAT